MVFVENAFKHAKSVKDDHIIIKINGTVEKNGYLIFSVQNNFYNEVSEINYSGIGLENVKKRLHLLYPDPLHSLVIKQEQGFFQVHLEIQLNIEPYE
jgi:LytS/YehU family sensor histidine kinase